MEHGAVERDGFRVSRCDGEVEGFVDAQGAATATFENNAARGMEAKRGSVVAQTPRSRMRNGFGSGNCEKRVSSVGTERVGIAETTFPVTQNVRAKHVLSLSQSRRLKKRARCSQCEQSAHQQNAEATNFCFGSCFHCVCFYKDTISS